VQFGDDVPGAVGGAVVDEDDFEREVVGFHHPLYPSVEFGDGFVLIIKRYYY
jgi:hypothetical protein